MRIKKLTPNPFQEKKLMIQDKEAYLKNLNEIFQKKLFRPPQIPPPLNQIQNMRITREAYNDMKVTIGGRPAESGGILLSKTHDFTITSFIFDIAAAKHSVIYQPDTEFLNSVLKGRNDEFIGIAHSHQRGGIHLSRQDKRAAWSNMTSPGNPHLNAYFMPLIQTIPDTDRFEIIPYIVTCHPKGMGRVLVRRVKLEIID